MKLYKNIVLAIITLIMLTCIGCGKKASDEIDFGTFEESLYRNKYFAMAITIPSDWSIQDNQAKQQLMHTGQKMIAGDDKNFQAALNASELQSVNLFAVFKHPLGTPVPYNQNISCVAERVSHMPGIRTGKDYHFHVKKLLESGQMKFSFPKEVYSELLSGVEFHVMSVELALGGMTVKQEYYVTIMKGYALVFIISFTTDEERNMLTNILKTLTFSYI